MAAHEELHNKLDDLEEKLKLAYRDGDFDSIAYIAREIERVELQMDGLEPYPSYSTGHPA